MLLQLRSTGTQTCVIPVLRMIAMLASTTASRTDQPVSSTATSQYLVQQPSHCQTVSNIFDQIRAVLLRACCMHLQRHMHMPCGATCGATPHLQRRLLLQGAADSCLAIPAAAALALGTLCLAADDAAPALGTVIGIDLGTTCEYPAVAQSTPSAPPTLGAALSVACLPHDMYSWPAALRHDPSEHALCGLTQTPVWACTRTAKWRSSPMTRATASHPRTWRSLTQSG